MRTKVISLILATALAATAPLAPAQAGSASLSDEQKALALIVGIAAIAAIANNAQDRRKDARKKEAEPKREITTPVIRGPITREPVIREHRPEPRQERLPKIYPRAEAQRPHHRQSVPSSCARRVQTQNGVRTAFGAPCLRRSGVNLARLPDRCERLADTGQRDVRFWGARCLTNNGVRIK